MHVGSWMWKKLLKYRDIAKTFHRKEIVSGAQTSFWFDDWSGLGRLFDTTGTRGYIDLGIPRTASVAMARAKPRRRNHRSQILRDITFALDNLRISPNSGNDVDLWRSSTDNFSKKFNSKQTWQLLRTHNLNKDWSMGLWFKHSTPKFRFLTWLALQDRLGTGDKMQHWNSNQNVGCSLCDETLESRNHLFFSCPYASEVWRSLTCNLLAREYTDQWDAFVQLLHKSNRDKITLFLFRYVFQATLYHIWRERNKRRHGELPVNEIRLTRTIDKTVRNRLLSIRKTQDREYDDGLSTWFGFSASPIPNSVL